MEGDGVIGQTSVRADAFLADNTPSGHGLSRIELDGENETSLQLSGNVKEVVNLTPESVLSVEKGRVDTITVDEKATDSTLEIASGATVDHVNLDVGTTVTGDGDIENLVVNAPGSTVTMLPDQIVVRPGIEATIDGERMDSAAAAESSADPRLLAGYPEITDLAPTSASVRFSANKRGTVYWAVTSVTDGSVRADDLINPPSYSTSILKRGTQSLTGSSSPATAKISGLTSDGSYYLSAVFVDARGEQSPLKVISFTTPDNTKPDFASGYPYLSKVTNVAAQATVMPTKTCRLYWAVLPKGAAAPTAEDFKSNAVTGNLGFGVMDVTKNTAYSFDVNNVPLEELESYDLYLWLTDVEGGQSSSVKKLSFTTVDKTPPKFNVDATVNSVKETSVGLYANLNEDGTLYWALVREGEEYPKPLAGQSGSVDLSSDTAKLQVMSGMNALKSGKVTMKENQDVSFTISGLDKETSYDLYYVAQDKAGNYSASVQVITIHTLDSNAPTATQEFTRFNGTESDVPLPNTDIRIVFSEAVQDAATNTSLVSLYEAVEAAADGSPEQEAARNQMASILRQNIQLYIDTGNGQPQLVEDRSTWAEDNPGADWTIDYRYAKVTLEEGKTVVTFPTTDDDASNPSALNLKSGADYFFILEGIADTSPSKNLMGRTPLDPFTTVFAIVNLSNPNISSLEQTGVTDDGNRVDVSWTLTPVTTESTTDSVDWDMVIWSDTSVTFSLWYREQGGNDDSWKPVKTNKDGSAYEHEIIVPDGAQRAGASLTRNFLDVSNNPDFHQLNELKENLQYQYAIHFTKVGTLDQPDTWSQRIQIGINILAGSSNALGTLANRLTPEDYEEALKKGVTNIGQPSDFTLTKQFSDQTPPVFASGHPRFESGSSALNMYLALDRQGTIYYVVAPKGTIPTSGSEGENFVGDDYGKLPEEGEYDAQNQFEYPRKITEPDRLNIVNAADAYGANPRIKHDSVPAGPSEIEELVEGLEPNTDYIAYFVIQGASNQIYSPVYAYQFRTADVEIPYLKLEALNPEVAFTPSQNADIDYALFAPNQLPTVFKQTITVETGKEDDPDTDDVDESKTSMTVLDAMLQTIDQSTGESYFDRYASQSLKDQVQQIIQRSATGGGNPVAVGGITADQNQAEQVDFTSAMQQDQENATYFYCLATAQNVLGSGYSFKAVENVHIPDTEPPALIFYSTTIDQKASKPNQGKYSGTLTLIFSEPLYYMDYLGSSSAGDPDTLRPVIQRRYGSDDTVSILTAMGNPGGFTTDGTSTSPTNTFTLKFTDIGHGTTITLPTGGVLSDASQNSNRAPFVLRFEVGESGIEGFVTSGEFTLVSGNYQPSN